VFRPPPSHYFPRAIYPYGYGAFGVGYFYYDPYAWYGYPYPYGGPPNYPLLEQSYTAGYATGEVRLLITPGDAQVYVDQYFAGTASDFEGKSGLKLAVGTHRIQMIAPGYEVLSFEIRVLSDQKLTYRGDLVPRR